MLKLSVCDCVSVYKLFVSISTVMGNDFYSDNYFTIKAYFQSIAWTKENCFN